MKPSWDNAPSWANWLAMDEDGEWYWFEDCPEVFDKPFGNGTWVCDKRYEKVVHWRLSLEQRPR